MPWTLTVFIEIYYLFLNKCFSRCISLVQFPVILSGCFTLFSAVWLFPQKRGPRELFIPLFQESAFKYIYSFLHSVLSPNEHCEVEIFCKLVVLQMSRKNQRISQRFNTDCLLLGFVKTFYSREIKCLLLLAHVYKDMWKRKI